MEKYLRNNKLRIRLIFKILIRIQKGVGNPQLGHIGAYYWREG